MDINFPVPKKEGCFECVDNIDRISKLPDEIIGKILSYLRTKNAVATSVLSKRWEHLWTLTSNLDFSDSSLIGCEDENDHMLKSRSFQSYVDNVIFHHGGLNVRKCWLFCHTISVSRVYSWICALIDCNVQELSLHCLITGMSGTYYQLPWRLFSCNTLVNLEICEDFVLDVPKYACFPRLKILNIHCALFVDDASMERLFSSCPVLENLTIMRRNDILEIMNIFVPSLKRLYISCDSSPLQIKINTPRLEHLEIDAKCRYVANFTSSLVHANLFGLDIYLLNAISQVECLVLKANDESLRNIIRDSALPILKNLKTLNLEVAEESLSDWKVLPNLLDSSPNLQALIFPDGLLSINSREEDFNHFNWQRPESMPRCLSTSLKAIEIFEFVGFQEELELVEYLLECGEVLEKMIIHRFHISEHPRIKKSVEGDRTLSELLTLRRSCSHDEVMSFKRSCSTCEVIFTDETMYTNLLVRNKDQRCFEYVHIMDMISKLPDEILAKILNYLPTEEALAASILSKRWEHLWILTSDLDFSDTWLNCYRDKNDRIIKMRSYQKYVERVIFYHGGSNIRKCNMSFDRKTLF